MPCKDCENNPKLRAAVICPDPWRSGARDEQTSAGRKKSENKLLSSKARYSPYGGGAGGGLGVGQKCSVCKKHLPAGGKYCTACAHHRGICYICGKQILDTSAYSGHENKLLDEKKPSKAEKAASLPTVRPQAPGAVKKKKEPSDDLDLAERQAQEAAAREQHKRDGAAAASTPAAAAASAPPASSAAAQQGGGGPTEKQRRGAWSELEGEGGALYYYNHETGATQWERPEGFADPGTQGGEGGEGGGWVKYTTPEGHPYYYKASTGETTWTLPAGVSG